MYFKQISKIFTLLFRKTTGHIDMPMVQQQHIQPHNNHLKFIGKLRPNTLFILIKVDSNSSGASFPVNPEGKSVSNLLLIPNLVQINRKRRFLRRYKRPCRTVWHKFLMSKFNGVQRTNIFVIYAGRSSVKARLN